mmetsp:Transcript_46435/g.132361  ORF Transcript_46435/g.132361 Transcript_46435/m.132361 type:complete len:201 (+) Transcript_46435:1915-2517(+)
MARHHPSNVASRNARATRRWRRSASALSVPNITWAYPCPIPNGISTGAAPMSRSSWIASVVVYTWNASTSPSRNNPSFRSRGTGTTSTAAGNAGSASASADRTICSVSDAAATRFPARSRSEATPRPGAVAMASGVAWSIAATARIRARPKSCAAHSVFCSTEPSTSASEPACRWSAQTRSGSSPAGGGALNSTSRPLCA